MSRWIVIAGLLIWANVAMSRDGTGLFGYFESQITGAAIESAFHHVQSNKLRVDLKYTPSNRMTFAANYDFITFHGKTRWSARDFLSEQVSSSIPDSLAGAYTITFEDQQFLDNAFVRLSFSRWDVTAGKQQISTGSGYVWNPTDVFNVKDVLDPTYEQPGHHAVRVDVDAGRSISLTALYSPEETWRTSGKLVQVKGRLPRFDTALLAIERVWCFHDYRQFDVATPGFVKRPERRRVFGANTEGELLGLGIYAEYAYNSMELSNDFHEWVAGVNYTFDFQTYAMGEFYRNTWAKSDYREYDLNDWMRSLAMEQKSISRDQLYVMCSHPVSDFIDLSLSSVWSISDGSFTVVPALTWSLFQDVDVMAYGNVNFGEDGTAYSKLLGDGGLLRIRAYF
jgi:hypothetical protein